MLGGINGYVASSIQSILLEEQLRATKRGHYRPKKHLTKKEFRLERLEDGKYARRFRRRRRKPTRMPQIERA